MKKSMKSKCFNVERLIKVNNMADVMPAFCTYNWHIVFDNRTFLI